MITQVKMPQGFNLDCMHTASFAHPLLTVALQLRKHYSCEWLAPSGLEPLGNVGLPFKRNGFKSLLAEGSERLSLLGQLPRPFLWTRSSLARYPLLDDN